MICSPGKNNPFIFCSLSFLVTFSNVYYSFPCIHFFFFAPLETNKVIIMCDCSKSYKPLPCPEGEEDVKTQGTKRG